MTKKEIWFHKSFTKLTLFQHSGNVLFRQSENMLFLSLPNKERKETLCQQGLFSTCQKTADGDWPLRNYFCSEYFTLHGGMQGNLKVRRHVLIKLDV